MAEKSKVYFSDFRCPSWRENLPQKLARLIMTAGFGDIDMEGKYVAIKMHFGEPGNMAYLRPNWAKVVVDLVKSQGGKPFLTDCNTLYVGGRKNALDHIESAYVNGFTPYSTGCHIIIADGLKGTDEVEVPVEGGEYVKSAEMADEVAVMYAGDIVEKAPTRALFDDPKHPYTIGLMNSIPDINDHVSRLRTLEGLVPSLYDMPSGCRFAPRCQFCCPECEAHRINLTTLSDGRQVRCRRFEA